MRDASETQAGLTMNSMQVSLHQLLVGTQCWCWLLLLLLSLSLSLSLLSCCWFSSVWLVWLVWLVGLVGLVGWLVGWCVVVCVFAFSSVPRCLFVLQVPTWTSTTWRSGCLDGGRLRPVVVVVVVVVWCGGRGRFGW